MDTSSLSAGVAIDMGLIRGLITALTMLVYAGIFWWAYRGANRERFESDALLPFDDERAFDASRPPTGSKPEDLQ